MNTIRTALAVASMGLSCTSAVYADSLAAKRFIMEHYVKPLPDSIARLPWTQFAQFIDPYTELLSQAEVGRWKGRFSGRAEGQTGIDYEWVPLGWVVTEISPNSPAYDAGLLPGDIVTSVNGRAPCWRDENGQYGSIFGVAGSVFVMEILRSGVCHTIGVPLAEYRTESVYVMVVGRTMCVVVLDFNFGAYDRFKQLTASVREENIDTVILDVRSNAGGAVVEATNLLSEFIPAGDTLLLERYRNSQEYTLSAGTGRWRKPRALYVLISQGTVSAGEIFAGGMKVRSNAVVIGSPTFGKGRIQRFYHGYKASSFSDSMIAGAKVTVGLYLAGGTLPVDSMGVQPHMNADLSFAPVRSLPSAISVIALRRSIQWPTQKTVDSINSLAGFDACHMIWCERALPLKAYRTIDTMRNRLIQHELSPRHAAVMNTLYAFDDEPAIGAAIRESYGNVLDAATLMNLSVERQLEHLAKLPALPRPAQDEIEDDAVASVSCDLGLRLAIIKDRVTITGVIPSAGAYEAGACVGDRLNAINGKPLASDLFQAQVQILNLVGKGLSVELLVQRGNRSLRLLCSGGVRVASMPMTYIDDTVGFIAADRFCATESSVFQIWRALLRMRDSGVKKVVFDLRGAQYGRVDHVLQLISHFTNDYMLVAHAKHNSGEVTKLDLKGNGSFATMSVTIVIDELTSGAAKIFVSAMKQRGNTTLVGVPTVGQVYEKRRLDITPVLALRYVWRSVTSGVIAPVTPDIRWKMRSPDPTVLSNLALQLPRIDQLRQRYSMPTKVEIEQTIKSLPTATRAEAESALAELIFGDGARLYNLARALRKSNHE